MLLGRLVKVVPSSPQVVVMYFPLMFIGSCVCSQTGKNQIIENYYGSNKVLQFPFFSINLFLLHIKN